ncbi:hypothetical protein WJR50_31875 [Catalinimonas sp. 4WD22]|uniref:hypothetical protein n=1 Tax=Catalinimonas locisalis TaxID=3133978 RepID=UPI00310194FE
MVLLSLVILYFGASWMVNSTSSLATILVSLPYSSSNIVAVGTSTRKLATSVVAALKNNQILRWETQ